MARRRREPTPDERRFVQIASHPSLGVEVTTGQAWVGVDQQVGHGSADALFALADDEYAAALRNAWDLQPLLAECWRGEHPERLLFHPGGATWRPEGWMPRRERMLRQPFEGELWWHVDALGAPDGSPSLERSRALAAGTVRVEADAGGVRSLALRLVGDGAYPRPAALVAGLDAGSDRAQVGAILGDAVDGIHHVEGNPLRVRYDEAGGAVALVLERGAVAPTPAGAIGVALEALGEPEEGPAFRALARLAGGTNRRWAVSSGHPRRLVAFEHGAEVQVEGDRVLSVRIDVRAFGGRAPLPATHGALRDAAGAPAAVAGTTSLHRFARGDLLVEHVGEGDAATVTAVTAVLRGVTVSHRIHRWRSGQFTRHLDALGRPASNPLVEHVRALPGVTVRMRGGVVDAVEVEPRASLPGCFADDMPSAPGRRDIPFARPTYLLERDDLYDFDGAWVHVHAPDGHRIGRITVRRDLPPRLDVERWVPPEDRGAWAPEA
ncbi:MULTISPECIES: hypothetical protein [unclassified Agrococcus]|uniref:hypothetical protein n=1 Tax=unclassified Agrococcus TaxID=2615065 RepID=UPI0036062AD3